jgi:hypothetical protein
VARARHSRRVHRQVCERHDLIIAAVIENQRPVTREFRSCVGWRRCVVPLPSLIGAAVRGRNQVQTGNAQRMSTLAHILQQHRAAGRMTDERDRAARAGDLRVDLCDPQ